MGIKRLFTFVKERFEQGSLEELRGKTLGIDGMGWLYQMFFSVNETSSRIYFPMIRKFEARFKLLEKYEIKFVVVIDGRSLEVKNHATQKRQEKR